MQEESKQNIRSRKKNKLEKDSDSEECCSHDHEETIEKLSEEEILRRATIMWDIIKSKQPKILNLIKEETSEK